MGVGAPTVSGDLRRWTVLLRRRDLLMRIPVNARLAGLLLVVVAVR